MKFDQRALRFCCAGSCLVGIVDVPERPIERGLLVITDAAQYRVGGHRQFALLSRTLAGRGIPVMRFDHRGCGDSEGEPRRCDTIDEDIRSAIAEFFMQMPDMKEIVIWGLGEAATAAALYAHGDPRVRGLILLNPRVEPPAPAVRPGPRQYYLGRLGELGFWKKVATGNVDFAASAAALRQHLREAAADNTVALPQRVLAGLSCFDGQVLVMEDMLGLTPRVPKFVKRYGDLGPGIDKAIGDYAAEVRSRAFPGPEHVYPMKAKKV